MLLLVHILIVEKKWKYNKHFNIYNIIYMYCEGFQQLFWLQ